MKLSIPAATLLEAVQSVQQAVAARTTKPILANIKLVASDDTLTLSATDLEVSAVRAVRGVSIQRAGSTVLSPKKLVEICRELKGDVALSVDDGGAVLRSGPKDKWKLPVENPDEFPEPPAKGEDLPSVSVGGDVLNGMLQRAVYAVSTKDATPRFNVNGLHIEVYDSGVRFVGTDTKRLAMADSAVIEGEAGKVKPLVPLKAINLLSRNLRDDGAVVISFDSNSVWFEVGEVLIYTRQVEGKFPPYQQFWPKKKTCTLSVQADDLCSKVKQAAIASDDESKRVEVSVAAGVMTLKAHGPDTGASEVTMELPGFDGPEVSFAIDPAYLCECLKSFAGESVEVDLIDERSPVIVRCGDLAKALVMILGERD